MPTTHFSIKTEKLIFNHMTFQKPAQNLFGGHAHNAYELILLIHGKGSYTINSSSLRLKKNSLILIKPLEYHYINLSTQEDYERYNILFSRDFFPKHLRKKVPDQNLLQPNEFVLHNIKKMDYYSTFLSESEFLDMEECTLKELLYNLPTLSSPTDISFNPILQNALNYIHENLWQVENISEISKRIGISSPYLFQLFKSVLHTSPHQYIIQQRILEAERLVQKGVPPTQIAKDCGFQSYSAFYKQYKKILGHNPTAASHYTLSPINNSSPLD